MSAADPGSDELLEVHEVQVDEEGGLSFALHCPAQGRVTRHRMWMKGSVKGNDTLRHEVTRSETCVRQGGNSEKGSAVEMVLQ